MKKTLLAASLLMAVGSAQAVITVDDSGGIFGNIPSAGETNEFLTAIGETTAFGCFGCNLMISTDVALSFSFYGSEAGFDNEFMFGDDVMFNTGGNTDPGGSFSYPAPLASASSDQWAAGLTPIDFSFVSPLGIAANGSNPDNTSNATPNFFLTIEACLGGEQSEGCTEEAFYSASTYWLFFDDAGADDDDNHDDMVISLTAREIVKVPEAGTLGLLGMGLAMMGFVARRRG